MRLLRGAAAEWALTGVPAALVAPFLAGLLHPGSRSADAWAAVGLTLLVHAAAVLLPVLPSARSRPARGARAAAAQRLSADLALLAVAALGYLELRRHHSLIADVGTGSASADPVLVLVLTLVVGAAALLLLRLLPLTSLLLDAFGRRSRGLVLALAGWQLSRLAARNAGPVVLMCLAVSVSAFATTALACLGGLASEQAAFTVGADVRIDPSADDGYPSAVLAAAYRALPGVTGVRPVTRSTVNLPGGATEDLVGTVGGPAPRTPSPVVPGIPLPGRPTALLLDERLRSDGSRVAPGLELTVQDAAGLVSVVPARLPAADGARHTVVVPLDVALSGGHPRAYPLTVTAVAVLPQPGTPPARLDLDLIRVGARETRSTSDTWVSRLPGRQVWSDGTDHAADSNEGACKGKLTDTYNPGTPGVCSIVPGSSAVLRTTVSTGIRPSPAISDSFGGLSDSDYDTLPGSQVRLVAGPLDGPAPLPVRADAATLRAARLHVGSTTTLDLGGGRITARIVGRVDATPGLGRGQGHLIADQRQLSTALTLSGADRQDPAFWWLSSTDSARTAAAAEAQPALGAVTTTARTAAALQSDPFRAGLRRVLELVRYLAPGFAVIAFTVHAVVSTRQRRKEFALLRAIGVRAMRPVRAARRRTGRSGAVRGDSGGVDGHGPGVSGPASGHGGRQRRGSLSAAAAGHSLGHGCADGGGNCPGDQRSCAGPRAVVGPGGSGAGVAGGGGPMNRAAVTRRLIRKESRGDLPMLACLAVLVLVLTALCAWAPALAGRQEDRALRQRVDAAQAQAPLISLSTTPEVFNTSPPSVDMAALLAAGRTLTHPLSGAAARHLSFTGGGSYDYDPASLLTPRPPGPASTSTQLTVSYLPSARAHLRYVSGRAPADHTPLTTAPQIGLSQATARALGVRTGSRLRAWSSRRRRGPRTPRPTRSWW